MRQLDEQLKGMPNDSTEDKEKSSDDADSTDGDKINEETPDGNTQLEQHSGTEPESEAVLHETTDSAGQPHTAEGKVAQRSARTKKSTAQDQEQTNDSTATGDPPDDSKPAAKRGPKKKCAD
jgi:hypothetical protein